MLEQFKWLIAANKLGGFHTVFSTLQLSAVSIKFNNEMGRKKHKFAVVLGKDNVNHKIEDYICQELQNTVLLF